MPEVADPPPRYPGATLELDATGQVVRRWLGRAAPTLRAEPDVFAALDVDDAAPAAAQVQLVLAQAIGAPADAWQIVAGDAPSTLTRRDGQLLNLLWEPVVAGDTIVGLALFVTAISTPRVELDDPVELNRICVDALALLDDSDAALQHLTADPSARPCVHRLFRNMHTIKGTTRGTHLEAVAGLAHVAEEAIEILRRGEDAEAAVLEEVAEALRALRAAVNAARPRGEVDDAMTELLAECRPALVDLHLAVSRLTDADRDTTEVARLAVERIRAASERAAMQALHVQCEATARAIAAIARGAQLTPGLLDEIDTLDLQIELYAAVYREVSASDSGPSLLVTMASWMDTLDDRTAPPFGGADARGQAPAVERSGSFASLADVMSQAGVPSLLAAFADPDPLAMRRALAVLVDAPAMFEPGRPRDEATVRFERVQTELTGALAALERQAPGVPLDELRALVARLSWVPLGGLSRRLARMTRTLGAELGKQVVADVALGDLVVAPELSRVLGEILVHAIRNALDHGIESPAERIAAGKDPAGAIHVEAYAMAGRVLVTVRDDGRGVALDRVRRTAIARGLRSAPQALLASDAELLDLLFHPGFSTAQAVTSVSGRGVGMDVIRSLAQERGGSVTLTSSPGRGAELTIDVPLMLEAPAPARPSGGFAAPRSTTRHTLPYPSRGSR